MTYACGSFVLGINLRDCDRAFGDIIEELVERDMITTEYSGSGEEPTYIGTSIGGIDETEDTDLTWFEDIIVQYRAMLDNKSSAEYVEFKKQLDAVLELDFEEFEEVEEEDWDAFKAWLVLEEPSVFLTWGSS
jgi:hypothetical protein